MLLGHSNLINTHSEVTLYFMNHESTHILKATVHVSEGIYYVCVVHRTIHEPLSTRPPQTTEDGNTDGFAPRHA